MANDRKLREEARSAGERNVVPGQSWMAAIGRGLWRELFENSQGTPAGNALREELGSLGYEQALRELFPDEFASGRLWGSENFPTDLMALSAPGMVPRGFGYGTPVPASRPRLPGPGAIEGEVLPPRTQIEGPLYDLTRPAAPHSGPVSGFDRMAVEALQRGRPVPGRRGPFRPEDFGDYWTHGGYFTPAENSFVEVASRRNPEGYYNAGLVDEMSARMAAGDRGAMRHPLYGPTGDMPPMGEAGVGPSPWERMPRPGVARREGGAQPQGGLPVVQGERLPAPGGGGVPALPGQGGQSVAPFGPPGGQGVMPYVAPIRNRYEPLVAMGIAAGLPASLGQFGFGPAGVPVAPQGIPHASLPPMYVGVPQQGGTPAPVRQAAPATKRAPTPTRKAARPQKAAQSQAPAAQPAPQPGWEGNFNYQVTKMLDQLFGTNEAERGREYQQYWEGR